MSTRRLSVFVALLAASPIIAHAEGGWRFVPASAADAARAQSSGIYPANLAEARLSYRDVHTGGSVAALTLLIQLPMPYVIVPGVRISNMYSLVRLEMPVATANLSMMPRATGLSDLHMIDAAIKYWDGIAVGVGFGMLFPFATEDLLGTGQLAIGPVAGVSVDIGSKRQASLNVVLENLTSIASTDDRPDINVLLVRPRINYYLPHATYLTLESSIRFDWERGGNATVPLTARAGLAASKWLVFGIEPTWVAVGNGEHDVSVALYGSYVGW